MNYRSLLFLSLAVTACTKTTGKPDEPAPAIAPTKPAPAPMPVPVATTSWLEAVSRTPVDDGPKVDATALGAAVEVQLLERGGLAKEMDAERTDLELVLSSPAGRRVIGVAGHESMGGEGLMFGSVRGVPALSPPRRYRAEDGFEDAPRFRSKAPVVFAWSTTAYPGDDEHYVITHDGDTLVVWFAENVYEEGPSKSWDKQITVRLAAGAAVSTPKVDDAAGVPTFNASSSLQVHEQLARAGGDNYNVTFDLQIGTTRGSLGSCSVSTKGETPGDHTWTAKALPAPAPITGTLVATRSCVDSYGQKAGFTLERRGEEVVLWRCSGCEQASDWLERPLMLKESVPE